MECVYNGQCTSALSLDTVFRQALRSRKTLWQPSPLPSCLVPKESKAVSPVSPAPLMPTTKRLDGINPLSMKRNVVPRSLTDVHVSMDNVVIMCHDPSLDRTTDANGIVQQKNWYGDMEHARTLKKGPDGRGYPVPTFKETIELLMRVRYLFPFAKGDDYVRYWTCFVHEWG